MTTRSMRSDLLAKNFASMGLIAFAGSYAAGIAQSAELEQYQYSAVKQSPSARSSSASPSQLQFYALENANTLVPQTFHRPTTAFELIIAELRQWHNLEENWDGEGALPPEVSTLRAAEKFTGLLANHASAPEPQLNPTGRAGLFWDEPSFYADLEFYPDNKIAYYIQKNGDKHKGIIAFEEEKLPAVFASLLPTV